MSNYFDHLLLLFRPSVGIFPREFKNYRIEIQMDTIINPCMQSAVGRVSCNRIALNCCTSSRAGSRTGLRPASELDSP